MIVVTAATGQLGRQVVEHLFSRVPAERVAVSVRDPAKASALAERGVRVRYGDYEDPVSLEHAFEGATRVLVVSAPALGEPAIRMNAAAIDAAANAGAERILYTSHVGVNEKSPFPPMPTHAATEAKLRALDVPTTALRNGFYAGFAPSLLGDALETGELRAPADGPVSWTTHADLAEATAVALTDEELDDEVLALTAADAIDLEDMAALASELTGRPIRRVVVNAAEHRAALLGQGLPEMRVEMRLGLLEASRLGQFARVDPTLERLLGRRPTAMTDVLREDRAVAGLLRTQ